MKVVTKKDFVQSHLSVIFSSTKHADTQEKEVILLFSINLRVSITNSQLSLAIAGITIR